MKKLVHFSALLGLILLSACNLNNPTKPVATNSVLGETSALTLVVQVQNPTDTFNAVGDVIDYNYIVTNTGATAMAGPVNVTDNIATVTCPDLTVVGNQDSVLDPAESITCTGTYSLTQADLDAGSVTDSATASAAGGTIVSAPSGVTLDLTSTGTPGKSLGLTKTANPSTYSQAGQTITYTYVIENTGTLSIGPAQFVVADDHANTPGVPFACGPDSTLLEPGNSISCTASYVISQQDMGLSSVTNTAVASGSDAQASPPASATVTNISSQNNVTPSITPAPSNLTPGSTIQHQVMKGDWMIQIARCYGVSYTSLRNANPQIPNPSQIDPGQLVTVPNIGSAGTIFGPPCMLFYTVLSGDTWSSIATQYRARVDVLQAANPSGLVIGAQIKVPINSAAPGAVQIPVSVGVVSTSTPVTPIPTSTNTPTSGQPTRITIASGTNSASVSGAVVGHETNSYVLTASQSQTMTINLSAPVNEIAIRIYDPTGILIKPLDANLTWTGLLPVTGDYRIDLVGLTDPTKNYILTVTITG